jgi:hypothetical protein
VSEEGAQVLGEQLRLLPGGEVAAAGHLREVGQVGGGALDPFPGRLVVEQGHRGRHPDLLARVQRPWLHPGSRRKARSASDSGAAPSPTYGSAAMVTWMPSTRPGPSTPSRLLT